MDGEWIFQRSELLLGKEKVERLSRKNVLVIGVGGVGAFAAEFIARAGVGNMTIVDGDCVEISNRNRQLLALESTMHQPKVKVMQQRLNDINPDIFVTAIEKFIEPEDVPELLNGNFDFVVDAIDTLAPKLSLIKYCVEAGIPIVSSMGAGAKYDVTKVRIADISKSFNCPLAYIVRKRLRHMGISKGVQTVFSEELPDRNAFVPCDEPNKKSQVGTVSYLPAVFGCACAQVVLQHLLGMK